MAKQSQRYWLTFPAERAKRPLIWELGKKFDLIFDIRSANVTDQVGIIALELTGDHKVLAAAVKWLRKNSVKVDPHRIGRSGGVNSWRAAELANPKWMKQCAKTLHYTAEEKLKILFKKALTEAIIWLIYDYKSRQYDV